QMSDSPSYWTAVTRSRLARRRVLQLSAAGVLGSAALSFFGCGGTKGGGSSSAARASLVSEPADTGSKAVNGGVYQVSVAGDPKTFDSISGTALDVPHAARVYSRLVKYEVFKYPQPVKASVVPDAATSWETSP